MSPAKISRPPGVWPPGSKLVVDLRGCEPVPKGSMKAFVPKGSKFASITDSNATRLKAYARDIREIAEREMNRQSLPCSDHQRFELLAVFYLPRAQSHYAAGGLRPGAPWAPTGKPDWDKLVRAACDAFTGMAYDDDARVTRAVVEKRFATKERDIGMWIELRVLPVTLAEVAAEHQPTLFR